MEIINCVSSSSCSIPTTDLITLPFPRRPKWIVSSASSGSISSHGSSDLAEVIPDSLSFFSPSRPIRWLLLNSDLNYEWYCSFFGFCNKGVWVVLVNVVVCGLIVVDCVWIFENFWCFGHWFLVNELVMKFNYGPKRSRTMDYGEICIYDFYFAGSL